MATPTSNHLDAIEVASLRLDVDQLVQPTRTFFELYDVDKDTNPSHLLTHLLTLEALLIRLNLLADRIHPHVFNSVYSPIKALQLSLKEIEEAGEGADPEHQDANGGQQWIETENGQWKLNIPLDLLLELTEMGFTEASCAVFLGCSERTLRRRKHELGIKKYNDQELSDEDVTQVS
ncbi:hypothetical protein CF326_g7394 [Tilletia indica]|nr:hypothetical protein CF326_g7394 [Tilletia indica]